MAKEGWISQRTAYAVYAISIGVSFIAVNTVVPQPYMDEIFHIRQAQTYTRTWKKYDDKLTTPPGLYIPSALLARFVGSWAATVPGLRAVNALLLLYLPYLVTDLLGLVYKPKLQFFLKRPYPSHESLIICNFPLLYFFGFLYYTDVASLVLVLLAYRQALRVAYITSAIAGLVSLTLRQTNILWVAYIAFEALCLEFDNISQRGKGQFRQSNELSSLSLLNISRALQLFFKAALANPLRVLAVAWPYVPVAGCFLSFIIWNNGIVLGDKSMHVAVLHIPQIFYFVGFASAFLLPYICTRKVIATTIYTLTGTFRRLLASASVSSLLSILIRKFTIVHPFLLADNRHYPFYVWRRIINFNHYSRYALAPGYLAAAVALKTVIGNASLWGTLPILAYIAVICLTLIPSPLLEFRYFIIPYIILRLHIRHVYKRQLRLELTIYILANLVTLVMFLCKPFKWPSESGWQRFMW